MKSNVKVSIIIPVYHGERTVSPLMETLRNELHGRLESEMIFVNDGSPDNSQQVLENLCDTYPNIKVVKLARNCGQHIAIFAGLKFATGDYTVVMDCDLQHHPRYIPLMLDKLKSTDSEIVFTEIESRNHDLLKNISSWIFSRLSRFFASRNDLYQIQSTNFCLFSKKATQAALLYNDVHRHFLYIMRDMGFKSSSIKIEHLARVAGRSSYTYFKLVRHALDGLVFQSNRLLYMAVAVGFGFVLFSFMLLSYAILQYFYHGAQPGWTSVLGTIILSTGVILICLGVVGIYIGKIFDQVRGRPLFIVDRINESRGIE